MYFISNMSNFSKLMYYIVYYGVFVVYYRAQLHNDDVKILNQYLNVQGTPIVGGGASEKSFDDSDVKVFDISINNRYGSALISKSIDSVNNKLVIEITHASVGDKDSILAFHAGDIIKKDTILDTR